MASLRACGLLLLHSALCLALMVGMMGWPSIHEQLLPRRHACVVAALWRRRFHDSAEMLLWLGLLSGLAALFEAVPGGGFVQDALEAIGGGVDARLPPETGCLKSTGVVHVAVVPWSLEGWLPDIPVQVRLAPPPPDCVEECDAFLAPAAWAPLDLLSGADAGALDTPALLTRAAAVALALNSGSRVLSLVARGDEASGASHAWSKDVRLSLACLTILQVVVATWRAAAFAPYLVGPLRGPAGLALCLLTSGLLELAWYPLAVLPAYYIRMAAGFAYELFEVLAALLMHMVTALLERFEHLFKRMVIDFGMELSLPGTSSRGDDECAICLGLLHPDAAPEEAAARLPMRRTSTAVERLRPRFRAQCTQAPRRLALIRFGGCGHAFHRACVLECASQAAWAPVCPTCRTEFIRLEWRWKMPPWMRPIVEAAHVGADAEVLCRAVVVTTTFALWLLFRGRVNVVIASRIAAGAGAA